MTADKHLKRVVRARAARTGESYTTARRNLLGRGARGGPPPFVPARSADIDWAAVEGLVVVPFIQDDGRLVLIDDGARVAVPAGAVAPGEDPYLDTALRVPLETAGFRRQRTFVVARSGPTVALWSEGHRYSGARPHHRADWWVGRCDAGAQRLRDQGDARLAQLVELVDDARRALTDDDHIAETGRLLEAAYLDPRNDSPRQGSGFSGSAEAWYAGRHHLTEAVERDGSFLDLGCANGHLLETLVGWCAERGHHIEPFGVDLSPALVAEAAARLPAWADRFHVGNALTWVPPDHRFDHVHTLLEVVPTARRADLLAHVCEHVVAPGGRVIVSHYVPAERLDQHPAVVLDALGYRVAGVTHPPADARVVAPSAWIDG